MYTRAEGIKRKWKKRSITPLTSIVSTIQRDAVYLNEKCKMGYEKSLEKQHVRTS
jgi:hypothetical protein